MVGDLGICEYGGKYSRRSVAASGRRHKAKDHIGKKLMSKKRKVEKYNAKTPNVEKSECLKPLMHKP